MAKAKIPKPPDPQSQEVQTLHRIACLTDTRLVCLKALMESDRDEDRYSAVLTFLEDIINNLQSATRRRERFLVALCQVAGVG